MSDIIVRFKPLGQEKLIRAIRTLENAQRGNTAATRRSTKETKKQTAANAGLLKSQRLVSGSFATMRSHMLLFSFAMSLGVRQLSQFGKQAAQVESLTTAFTSLTGGSTNASIALDRLQEATNNTMSQMELFKQANNAMVLGVSRNSQEMAELFDMAQRLGRALGRDTASSVESLVTGIGRQSRLMLDNIGIIVKAEQAYKTYALQLGKSEKSLTNQERRQAFLNATLVSARMKLKSLGKETLTAQDSYDQLGTSISDLGVEIGKLVNDSIIPAMKATTEFINGLDKEKLKNITEIIISLGAGFVAFRKFGAIVAGVSATIQSSIAGILTFLGLGIGTKPGFLGILTKLITKIAKFITWQRALAAGVFFATKAILKYTGIIGGSSKETEKATKNTKKLNNAMKSVKTQEISLELQAFIDKMKLTNEFLELVAKSMQTDLIKAFEFDFDVVTPFSLAQEEINKTKNEIVLAQSEVDRLGKLFQSGNLQDFDAARKAQEKLDALNATLTILQTKVNQGIIHKFIDDAAIQNLEIFKEKFTEITGISAEGFFQTGEAEALSASLGTVITTEEQLLAVLNAIKKEDVALNAEAVAKIANNVILTETNKELAAAQKLVESTIKSTTIAEKENVDNAIQNLETKKTLTVEEAKALEILKQKQKSLAIQRKLENNHLYQQADAYAMVGQSMIAVGKVAGMHQKDMLALQVIVAIANAYKAASDTWADTTITPTILRAAAAASHFASAYANVRGIQNQMQKIGSGGSGGGGGVYGSFEQGGYVGGNRHAQGGTIIEAERGEFVMSRNAVESIGLETLNQMNQSGGGGSINVSVTGNVLTQDFVEGELAESIKEAVRRGSDFGIS